MTGMKTKKVSGANQVMVDHSHLELFPDKLHSIKVIGANCIDRTEAK